MSTKEHDTDPSTPGAKQRLSEPRTAVAPVSTEEGESSSTEAPSLRSATNPGVGPPESTRAPPAQPMGIVVPPPSVPPRKLNDSVDMLLEGIPEESQSRSRTTPQTDGQASAAYHAQHGVHAGRRSPADEPKVVIERAPSAQTVRLQRQKLPKLSMAAREGVVSLLDTEDVTIVSAPPMKSRLVMAVAAGLLVVAGIFVLLRVTSTARLAAATTGTSAPSAAAGTPPIAPPPLARSGGVSTVTLVPPTALSVDGRPPGVEPSSPGPVASPAAPSVVAPGPQPQATATPGPPSAKASALPSSRPPRPHPRPVTPPPGSDVGEFKTTF